MRRTIHWHSLLEEYEEAIKNLSSIKYKTALEIIPKEVVDFFHLTKISFCKDNLTIKVKKWFKICHGISSCIQLPMKWSNNFLVLGGGGGLLNQLERVISILNLICPCTY